MVETLLIGGGILIAFLLFIGWLVSSNEGEDTTTTTPPPSPDTQAELIVPNNPFSTGINYSNIDIVLRGKAADGSSLQQFVVKAKDSSGNEHDQQITSVSGSQDQKNIHLSDIIGNATASSPLNIPLELIVVDDSPNNDVDHGQINIYDSSGGGRGGNDGDNNVDVDIDNAVQQVLQQLIAGNVGGGGAGGNGPIVIGNSQQQQQQQQMGGGGVYGGISPQVYQMFMQQMQHMQMNQQQMMQQMMMFMQQNNYNQIDNEFMVQFMQQVMDVDIDIGDINIGGGGSGSGDVEIQINQIVNNINITRIEKKTVQLKKEIDVDVRQSLEAEVNLIMIKLLELIKEGRYKSKGDLIIIKTDKNEEKVKVETLIQFLNILAIIKDKDRRKLILAIINEKIDIKASLEVKLEQLIIIYQESGSSNSSKERSNPVPIGDKRTARGSQERTTPERNRERPPVGYGPANDRPPEDNDNNLNDDNNRNDMSGKSDLDSIREFVKEINQLESHLEKEEELEKDALKKQKKAEKELKHAFETLREDEATLHILVEFRKHDFSGMSQMEALNTIQNDISSDPSNTIQIDKHMNKDRLKEVQQAFGLIEQALEEIKQADQEIAEADRDAQQEQTDVKRIESLVSQLEMGMEQYSHFAQASGGSR